MNRLISFALAFLSIAQIYGCKEDTVSPPKQVLFAISGKITSGDSLSGAKLSMEVSYEVNNGIYGYVFDKTTIGSNGEFQLNIPSAPSFLLVDKEDLGNLSFSDTTAKFDPNSGFSVFEKSNGTYLGYIYCSEKARDSTGNSGNYWISFLYSTKTLTITGTDSVVGPYYKTRFDDHLLVNAGWNQLVHHITRLDSANYNITAVVDNDFKGNWFFGKNEFLPPNNSLNLPSRHARARLPRQSAVRECILQTNSSLESWANRARIDTAPKVSSNPLACLWNGKAKVSASFLCSKCVAQLQV